MLGNAPKRRSLWRETRGVCLPEILVALAVGMGVVAMACEIVGDMGSRVRKQHRAMAIEQEVRLGLAIFEEEVQAAETGMAEQPSIYRAARDVVEFSANVNGRETVLTEVALAGQRELTVEDGTGWEQGKRVRVCAHRQCWYARLAQDGRRSRLVLETPVPESLPRGIEVSVSNVVRYYVVPGGRETVRLMRQIDGGANALMGDLLAATFEYRDRDGQPTQDLTRVASVRLVLAVDGERRQIIKDIGLRM